MATARVFDSEGSQAVRLPEEVRLSGSEVEIFRRGDEVVIREMIGGSGYLHALGVLARLPDDFALPEDLPPRRRDRLE